PFAVRATDLALFFALIVVMMVAMMLPSALPMALAYYGMTRLEDGRPTKPADVVGTIAFLFPYFVVWGFFGVAALVGLMAFGLVGSTLMGPALFLSAGILLAAGLWQVTRTKEVCLSQCTSPMEFVLRHWRGGRLRHVIVPRTRDPPSSRSIGHGRGNCHQVSDRGEEHPRDCQQAADRSEDDRRVHADDFPESASQEAPNRERAPDEEAHRRIEP